jgi:SAM-dependent methyltransferase
MQPTAEPSATSEYDVFAPFYDAFTWASDYEAWTRHVLALSRRLGLHGSTLLDVACGTGKSFMPFLERGFEVTGCDASAGMLAEAEYKASGTPLVETDVRELPALGSFDLVTCFDDSLNYLPNEADLADAFRSIAANLAAHGLFLFDLNTLLAYRTTFAQDRVSTREALIFAWRGESTPDAEIGCRAAARIDVFAPLDRGLYRRVTTRHRQRHLPRERVLARLAEAKLDCLGVFGVLNDGSLDPEADELRQLKVLYAARREEGGDPT